MSMARRANCLVNWPKGVRAAGLGALLVAVGLMGACDPEDDAATPEPGRAAEAVRDAAIERLGRPNGQDDEVAADDSSPSEAQPNEPAEAAKTKPTIVLRRPWPPTELPLALLATMGAKDPASSRATVRDEDSGVIASYRPGDGIREGVTVLSIEDGLVELSNAGEVEYLSISEIPVELSANDVFYPDLVAELHLSGSMDDGMQLPPGPEYTIKSENYAWATPRTIALLRDGIHEYAKGRNVPKVHIGDISRRGGGPFKPHLSHQDGFDVDIAYVLHDRRSRFGVATAGTLDRKHTWGLLQALLDTHAVAYVFLDYEVQRLLYEHARADGMTAEQLEPLFQYPYGRRAAQGLIRHWRGHRNHFHVRFSAG